MIILASLLVTGCADLQRKIHGEDNPFGRLSHKDHRRSVSTAFLSNGEQMKDLQRQLNVVGRRLGFNAGRPDGIYGDKTRSAIRAFQRHQGLPVDGVPSHDVLRRARSEAARENVEFAKLRPDMSSEKKTAPARVGQPAIGKCIEYQDLGQGGVYAKMIWDKTVESLPVDIRGYLAGLCLPEDRATLERLYLFLVEQGALHSRLTMVKYDELVALATEAGVDLGVRQDAFRRSVETLNQDVQALAGGGTEGIGQLIQHYEQDARSAERLMENLPLGYQQLEAQYKGRMRAIMGVALAHSVSSTFYLARSGYTAKRITDTVDLGEFRSLGEADEQNSFKALFGKAMIFVGVAAENLQIAKFIASKGEEMGAMLTAAATAIKTMTQDIENVPRIDPAETEKELDQLRNNNNVTLDELERQFQSEQSAQLKQV